MRCDIIVVENLRFLPSIRKRKAEVFKSLHFGDRFKKLLFWCPKTPFTWKRRAKTEKKIPISVQKYHRFMSDNRCCLTKYYKGLYSDLSDRYSGVKNSNKNTLEFLTLCPRLNLWCLFAFLAVLGRF